MTKLSRKELISFLKYDPKTGNFHWKKPNAPRMKKMDIAGCSTPSGIKIEVNRKIYFGHILAYLFKEKKWPEYEINHKNGNKLDNRWCNLELADHKELKGKLTVKKLKEILSYDPLTGKFAWIKSLSNRKPLGSQAGYLSKNDGYIYIRIYKYRTTAQRWAWFYMEGYWPEHEIDHINRIKTDNRWNNLRHITHRCNSRNTPKRSDNKTGIAGVFEHKGGFMARIKKEYLGYFKDKDDAVKARWKAERANGYPNCQTTSTAYLYLKDKGII